MATVPTSLPTTQATTSLWTCGRWKRTSSNRSGGSTVLAAFSWVARPPALYAPGPRVDSVQRGDGRASRHAELRPLRVKQGRLAHARSKHGARIRPARPARRPCRDRRRHRRRTRAYALHRACEREGRPTDCSISTPSPMHSGRFTVSTVPRGRTNSICALSKKRSKRSRTPIQSISRSRK